MTSCAQAKRWDSWCEGVCKLLGFYGTLDAFTSSMPKEQFFYPETASLVKDLDRAAQRAGASRGQTFEDFLLLSLAALSGGQMEDQYMATVKKYADGEKGKRSIDLLTKLFANIVSIMDQTRADILGDIYQGAITHGEAGQFMTPESITTLMAKMMVTGKEKSICDPCCGSGRMLLAASEINPQAELIGQDIDLRCVRMTAMNLALHNKYGYVIWGDSLKVEKKLVYRTGFDGSGVVREIPVAACPFPATESDVDTLGREPDMLF